MKTKTICYATGLMLFPIVVETIVFGFVVLLLKAGGYFPSDRIIFLTATVTAFIICPIFLYFTGLWKWINIKKPRILPTLFYLGITLLFLYFVNLFTRIVEPDSYIKPLFSWMRLIEMVAFAPIIEEVFFRGIAIEYLKRHQFQNWTIIVVTSLVFAFPHIVPLVNMYGFRWHHLEYFICPIIFAVPYLKDRNLTYCILMHALYNLTRTLPIDIFNIC